MKNLEDQLQIACVTWFRYQYPDVVIMAIPNGGKRNVIEAAKLKRTGTLAGVADLFVMRAKIDNSRDMELQRHGITWFKEGPTITHGIFIELKVGKNTQTEAQKEFEQKAKQAGYAYHVCRSIDEFMKIVNEYLT